MVERGDPWWIVETPRGTQRVCGLRLGVLDGYLIQPQFGGHDVKWGDTFERCWAPGAWWSFRPDDEPLVE